MAVANGNIYLTALNGLFCLNAQTGAEVWWFGGTGTELEVSSPAVTASGYLYVGEGNGNVYCLDATDGADVWYYATGGGVSSSPAIVKGVLYVGSEHQVYAFGTTHVLQNATLSMDISAQNQKTSFLLTISGTITPAQSGTVAIYEIINDSYWMPPNYAPLSSGSYSLKLRVDNGTSSFMQTDQATYNTTPSYLR